MTGQGRPSNRKLHRVLFYGDHLDNVRDMAHLMGLKVLIEGKEMAEPLGAREEA